MLDPAAAEAIVGVVLVSGMWPYREVDEKKSLGRLNVVHNEALQERLLALTGAPSLWDVGYRTGGETRPLFTREGEIEPTLVSVALRAMLPAGLPVVELPLAGMVEASANRPKVSYPGQRLYLLSTSYITNFDDLERALAAARGLGAGPLVCGGYLATRNPREAVEAGADLVIVGDAEDALPKLITQLQQGGALEDVPNLFYLDQHGAPVQTTTRIALLDDIPVATPAGDLTRMTIPYESMRGCPYHCGFCSYPLLSTKWRFKSAEKLIEDFSTVESRGASSISALDSTFTIPPKRLRAFLAQYVEAGLSIPWGAYSRVTPLKDEEIVRALKRANNKWLSIGFESGSARMLEIMKKGTRLGDGHLALRMLAKHEISPWSNFIVGYPGETEATVAETVQFMTHALFGFYGLYVFNIRDRGMPVLSDPQAQVHYDDIGSEWTHVTMNSEQASELRWSAYLQVAASNERAINVDIFRGSNVEKTYGAWETGFAALKAIELLVLDTVASDDLRRLGNVSTAQIEELVCARLATAPEGAARR